MAKKRDDHRVIGKKLDLFSFHDVRLKYDPYIKFNPLGEDGPYRIKGSLDDFL